MFRILSRGILLSSLLLWVRMLLASPLVSVDDSLHIRTLLSKGQYLCQHRQCEEAVRLWHTRLAELSLRDPEAYRLADAYVHAVFEHRLQMYEGKAAELYLEMLAFPAPASVRRIQEHHLAQLSFILPDSMAAYPGLRLITWWNQQDPLPATPVNERLVEHLQRVAEAERRFPDSGKVEGFDARGALYIRLGRPRTRATVRVDTHRLIRALSEAGITPAGSFAPLPNEFWEYRHLGEAVHYLFVLKGGRFRQGHALDLIPDYLFTATRRGMSSARRRVVAGVLLEAMDALARELALRHPAYETLLQTVERYQEELRYTAGALAPDWARTLQTEVRQMVREQEQAQEMQEPRVYSSVGEGLPLLDTALRMVRFQDRTGQTYVHLYWSHRPDLFRHTAWPEMGEQEAFMVDMVLVQYTLAFQRGAEIHRQYLIRQSADPVLQHLVVPLSDTLRGIGVEWDLFGVQKDSTGQWEVIRYLATQALPPRSITPLRTDRMEMSDLLPVLEDSSAVYPFATLYADTPLGVYFEVYHLTPDASGACRYEVTYTVRSNGKEEPVAARYRVETSDTRVRERVTLDLQSFRGKKKELVLLVQVRDLVAGTEVQRTLPFRIIR